MRVGHRVGECWRPAATDNAEMKPGPSGINNRTRRGRRAAKRTRLLGQYALSMQPRHLHTQEWLAQSN